MPNDVRRHVGACRDVGSSRRGPIEAQLSESSRFASNRNAGDEGPFLPRAGMSARCRHVGVALRRSTELRGQRATRGMPASWHRTCLCNGRTAVARATDGHDSTRRKLDEHEGTAGRSPQRACETARHSARRLHPDSGIALPVAVLQPSRAGQFSSRSLPTHWHERRRADCHVPEKELPWRGEWCPCSASCCCMASLARPLRSMEAEAAAADRVAWRTRRPRRAPTR